MAIKVYNSLSGKKEIIKPIKKGNIGMYTCGLTVYDYAHVGNLRSFIFEDLLRRTLETKFKLKHVMNITDVGHLVSDADEGEDKMEKGAKREHKTAWEIALFYTQAFKSDMKKLNLKSPHIMPKATDHIQEMLGIIKILEKKGYTYRIEDGIYFDTSKLKKYAVFAKHNIEGLKAGARVEVAQGKKNPTDFALWKFSQRTDASQRRTASMHLGLSTQRTDANESMPLASKHIGVIQFKKRDMEWDSPFGRGFPGWHVECSAMAIKYLGKTFDIHCGGIDHIPVHHTNEIAQSESATGKKFANYWLHNEHLMIDNRKMSKSLGNFYLLSDIIARGFSPMAFRYFCLSAHYRTQLNFTWDALKNASKTVDSLNNFIFRIKNLGEPMPKASKRSVKQKKNIMIISELKNTKKQFFDHLYDDLNTPQALAVLFNFISAVNKEIEEQRADKASLDAVYKFMKEVNKILDVITESEAEINKEQYDMIKQREQFRKDKNFQKADEMREQLKKQGILVEDTQQGTVWKVTKS